MTTPARELRDALAEALFRADYVPRLYDWSVASPNQVDFYTGRANLLLASLPSVKLKMGWEE